jgi:hypothetical protein
MPVGALVRIFPVALQRSKVLASFMVLPLLLQSDLTMRSRNLLVTGFIICLTSWSVVAPNSLVAQETVRFTGYPDAQEFTVVSRKGTSLFYPCVQCHSVMQPRSEIRQLYAPHQIEIEHGSGRIWCLSCHDINTRSNLTTLLGEAVDFDDAHLVCGGCHSNRHKDWYFGAHGKRVDNWQGERTLYSCTHCHDAHKPAIQARAPKPAPPVRAGLEFKRHAENDDSPPGSTTMSTNENE